jgi:hypothetical protein
MAKKKDTVKITEDKNLERDLGTSAIINTNIGAYEARLNRISNSKIQTDIDAKQREDIEALKTDVAEIKKMLKQIASK